MAKKRGKSVWEDRNPPQIFDQRHFNWLAGWLKQYREGQVDSIADYTAMSLAMKIGAQHPKFDWLAFMRAAGVTADSEYMQRSAPMPRVLRQDKTSPTGRTPRKPNIQGTHPRTSEVAAMRRALAEHEGD